MQKEIGDYVVLSLSEDDLVRGIAEMEDLRDALLMLKTLTEQDKKDMRETFGIAITAMQMVWANMQEDEGNNLPVPCKECPLLKRCNQEDWRYCRWDYVAREGTDE